MDQISRSEAPYTILFFQDSSLSLETRLAAFRQIPLNYDPPSSTELSRSELAIQCRQLFTEQTPLTSVSAEWMNRLRDIPAYPADDIARQMRAGEDRPGRNMAAFCYKKMMAPDDRSPDKYHLIEMIELGNEPAQEKLAQQVTTFIQQDVRSGTHPAEPGQSDQMFTLRNDRMRATRPLGKITAKYCRPKRKYVEKYMLSRSAPLASHDQNKANCLSSEDVATPSEDREPGITSGSSQTGM